MNRISALSLEFLLISFGAFNASAQYHPGSAGYNTVVVPGNSLGKFGTGSMNSWGAFSQGSGGRLDGPLERGQSVKRGELHLPIVSAMVVPNVKSKVRLSIPAVPSRSDRKTGLQVMLRPRA